MILSDLYKEANITSFAFTLIYLSLVQGWSLNTGYIMRVVTVINSTYHNTRKRLAQQQQEEI